MLSLGKTQEQLAMEYDALAMTCPKTGILCEQSALARPDYYKTEIFGNFAEYSFEGEQFCGVKDYGGYLGSLYGDYMKLPPEDQRENRHQIVKVDFGK
jgi:phosphorylcholine metabolism protein LicD